MIHEGNCYYFSVPLVAVVKCNVSNRRTHTPVGCGNFYALGRTHIDLLAVFVWSIGLWDFGALEERTGLSNSRSHEGFSAVVRSLKILQGLHRGQDPDGREVVVEP